MTQYTEEVDSYHHKSIMTNEILKYLSIKPGFVIVDATVGGAGHLNCLAKAVDIKGKIIAIDKDKHTHTTTKINNIVKKFKNIKLFKANFSELPKILVSEKIKNIDGLLCDLGVSLFQLKNTGRGFSFYKDDLLDMRMNTNSYPSVFELINRCSEMDLVNMLEKYGQEEKARHIAKIIKSINPFPNSTLFLANIINYNKSRTGTKKVHTATKIFQALRTAINKEMLELDLLLNSLNTIIKPGGRVAFISFHSLEDRKIKFFFKKNANTWKMINKKKLIPSSVEIKNNKHAKSAKLRVFEKITNVSNP